MEWSVSIVWYVVESKSWSVSVCVFVSVCVCVFVDVFGGTSGGVSTCMFLRSTSARSLMEQVSGVSVSSRPLPLALALMTGAAWRSANGEAGAGD